MVVDRSAAVMVVVVVVVEPVLLGASWIVSVGMSIRCECVRIMIVMMIWLRG